MSALRFISVSAIALAAAACGEAPEVDAVDEVDASGAQTESVEMDAAEPAAAPQSASAEEDSEALDALEMLARTMCGAGDVGFGDLLPEGAGFASRGPDARVHTAWNLDGDVGESVIYTPAIAMEERTVFDVAVATFQRHNLVAGFDRTGITGADRGRDGRFCVVQTEREVVEALRDAVQTAEAARDAQQD